MAKLTTYFWPWADKFKDGAVNWEKKWNEEQAEIERLQAISDALPEGTIVDALLSFPRGDGAAYYIVTKEKPLTIAWIQVGDSWAIEHWAVRGLLKEDILKQLRYRRILTEQKTHFKSKEGECTTTT